VAEQRHVPVLGWLQETKEVLGAVVAIVLAVIAIVHWGGDVVGWVRGNDNASTPPTQGKLSVEQDHIVTKPGASFAEFSVSGEAQGVDGKRCILRWQTFDAGNDQRLAGPGQRGAQAIALDHHVCLANRTFDVPAPANVDSLYAEVSLESQSGARLAPPAKSGILVLANSSG
jgi:hypothetical protein